MTQSGQTGAAQAPVVGIDIGGTAIKMGLVTAGGETLAKKTVPTLKIDSSAAFDRVCAAVRELCAAQPGAPAAIGLDVPGVALPDGTLVMAPNVTIDLPGLVSAFGQAFPRAPIAPINDANAAALGEAWLGVGAASTVFVTLGTGVGAGVILDGHVVTGEHGAAGEVGHMCVEFDHGEPCNCGLRGCLEMYASARGLIRMYREECGRRGCPCVEIRHATDARSVFEAARAGDEAARAACRRVGEYLARALAAIASTLDPASFVVGGGMCGGWDTYERALHERYRELALPSCRDTPIVCATLGNDAGFLGAARHALSRL